MECRVEWTVEWRLLETVAMPHQYGYGRRNGMRGRSLISAVALTLLAPAPGLAQGRTWEWDWGMHPMMFMWGAGGLVMMFMMLAFWGLIIAGLVVGLRWLVGQGRPAAHDEALEILRQRYARGEIDKQEFDTRRRDLGH